MAEDKTKDIENAPEPTDKDVAAIREFAKNLGYDFATIPGDIDRDEVENERWMEENPTWLRAAQTIYMMEKGINADPALTQSIDQMTDEQRGELSEWGFDHMGWTDDNLWSLKQRVDSIENATPEQQAAFLYMMETYGQLDMSISETANALWRGFTSPDNAAIMAGSLGLGLFTGGTSILAGLGAVAAKTVASRGALAVAKRYLTSNIGKAVAAGTLEGTVAGLTDGHLRQKIQTSTGVVDYDLSKTLEGGAYGAAFGAALGGGFFIGGKAAKKGFQSIKAKFSKSADGSATPAAADAPHESAKLDAEATGAEPTVKTETPAAGDEQIIVTQAPVGAGYGWTHQGTLLSQMSGMPAHINLAPEGLGGGAPNTPHMQPQPQQLPQANAGGTTASNNAIPEGFAEKRLVRPGKKGTAEELIQKWIDKNGNTHKNWWVGLSDAEKGDIVQKVKNFEHFVGPKETRSAAKTPQSTSASTNASDDAAIVDRATQRGMNVDMTRPDGTRIVITAPGQTPAAPGATTSAQQPAAGATHSTPFQGAYGPQTVNGTVTPGNTAQPQNPPQNLGVTWGTAQGSYGPQTVNAGPNYTAGTTTGGGAGGGTGEVSTRSPLDRPLPSSTVSEKDTFDDIKIKLPKFAPPKDPIKLMARRSWNPLKLFTRWTPLSAYQIRARGNTRPVIKAVDELMANLGLSGKIENGTYQKGSIQQLHEDIMHAQEIGGNVKESFEKFLSQNDDELTHLRASVQKLRKHVEDTYGWENPETKAIETREKSTIRYGLTAAQKSSLIDYLNDIDSLAFDLQQGTKSKIAEEIARNLKKVENGALSMEAFENSATGLSRAHWLANNAYIRTEKKYPSGDGTTPASNQWAKALERSLDMGVYNPHPHAYDPVSYKELTEDNLEQLWQNDILGVYGERDENGDMKIDWNKVPDSAVVNFASNMEKFLTRGLGHEAIFTIDMLRRLRQTWGSGDKKTLPGTKNLIDILKKSEHYTSGENPAYVKWVDDVHKIMKKDYAGAADNKWFGLYGKFFENNRPNQHRAIQNEYFFNFAERWPGTGKISKPGWIYARNRYLLNPLKINLRYFAGAKQVDSANTTQWGAPLKDYFSGKLDVTWKDETETGLSIARRATLRVATLGAIDDVSGKTLIKPSKKALYIGATSAGFIVFGTAVKSTGEDDSTLDIIGDSIVSIGAGTAQFGALPITALYSTAFDEGGIAAAWDNTRWIPEEIHQTSDWLSNFFTDEQMAGLTEEEKKEFAVRARHLIEEETGISLLSQTEKDKLIASVQALEKIEFDVSRTAYNNLDKAQKEQLKTISAQIKTLIDKQKGGAELSEEEQKQFTQLEEQYFTIILDAADLSESEKTELVAKRTQLESEIHALLVKAADLKEQNSPAVAIEDEPDLEKDTGDEKKKTQEKKDESGQEKQETYEAQIKRLEKQITELQKDANKNKQEIKKLQEMIAGLKAGDEKAVAEAEKYFEEQQAKELENWKQAGLDAAESTWNWLKPRELGQNDKFGRTANNLGTFFKGAATDGFDVAWSFLTDLADPNTGKYGKDGQSWLQYLIAAGVGLISPTLLENVPVFGKIFKLLHKIPILGPMITAVGAFLLTKKMLEGAMKTPQAVLMTSDDKTEVNHTPSSVTRDGGSMRVQSGDGQRIEYRLANETLDATLKARKAVARNTRGEDVGHAVQQSGQNLPNAIRRSNSVSYTVGSGAHIPTVLKPSNDQFIVTPAMGKDHAASSNGNSTVRAFDDAANRYENMPDAVAKTAGPGAYAAYSGGMQRVQGNGTVDYIVEPHGKSAAAMAPAPEYEVRH